MKIIASLVLLISALLLITAFLLVTPTFIANHLSPDNHLDDNTVLRIYEVRGRALVCGGLAVLLSGVIVLFPQLPDKISKLSKRICDISISASRSFLGHKAIVRARAICSHHPFRVALLLTALMFGLFALVATPAYDTNDDGAMARIASGRYSGEPTEFLIFSSTLIGQILKRLYDLSDRINWYALYLYSVHFISMTVLLYIFLDQERRGRSLSAFLLLFIFFELYLLLRVQFTSTSVVAAQSGVLLMLHLANKQTNKVPLFAFPAAALLIVLGGLVREQAMFLALLVSLPLVVFVFLRTRSKAIPIVIALALLMSLGAGQYDRYRYSRDDGWFAYMEYNAARGKIHDSPIAKNVHEETVLRAVGWSENDAAMFISWFFSDREIYSKDKLETLLYEFPGTDKRRTVSQTWAYLQLKIGRQQRYLWVTLFIFLLCLVLTPTNKLRFFLRSSVVIVLATGVCCYLGFTAKLPPRVLIPMIFLVNASFAYLLVEDASPGREISHRRSRHHQGFAKTSIALFLITLGAYLALSHASYLVDLNRANIHHNQAFMTLMSQLADGFQSHNQEPPLFVCWGAAYPSQWAPLFHLLDEVSLLPLGWSTHSPPWEATMRRYSIDNVYKALYERDDVFLMCSPNKIKLLELFVKEHLGEDIIAECMLEDRATNVYVYKMHRLANLSNQSSVQ